VIEAVLVRLLMWWKPEPRAGDRWTDGNGRVHVLAARDEDENLVADGVRL
jgi:hypothetical protein